jgi:hypothetical protein
MNRLTVGAALVALGAFAGPLCADDAAPSPMAKAPWYKRWFGVGPDPVVTPKPAKRDPAAEAASARSRAEADLDRRQRVCTELRQIAFDTNNTELEAKADALERQAWELYQKQTQHLPCSRLMPAQSEEKALDQRLGTSTAAADAADKLTTPAINVPSRRVQASAKREEQP